MDVVGGVCEGKPNTFDTSSKGKYIVSYLIKQDLFCLITTDLFLGFSALQ